MARYGDDDIETSDSEYYSDVYQRLSDKLGALPSIREFSRQTGIAYTTVQNWVAKAKAGEPLNLTSRSRDRLQMALTGLSRSPTIDRGKTVAINASGFSQAHLNAMTSPTGDPRFQVVYASTRTKSGYASMGWKGDRGQTVADFVRQNGLKPESIRRILWKK